MPSIDATDRALPARLAAGDPVTGLDNRLSFDRRLRELLSSHSGRPGLDVTLILLDLDRFAAVTEHLGSQAGDRLLVEVARRLVALAPEGSLAARVGGDEFAVVPPAGTDEAEVHRIALTIAEGLRSPYALAEAQSLVVAPATLGVTRSGHRRVGPGDLLREADTALHRAQAGSERYELAGAQDRADVRRVAQERLADLVGKKSLALLYQPIVDFSNGRTVGAEALLRLVDGDRLVPPDLFLDLAEDTDLVVDLDAWVLEEAIAQLARWSEWTDGPQAPWLSVNLSARSVRDPRLPRRLVEAVKRGELARDRIRIELKERSFVGAPPSAEAALRNLLVNGVQVGIEDFGTGRAALAAVEHFPLDFVKIDRSFVASIGDARDGDEVIMAMVESAHSRGMRVIAEGVESPRQARRLRECGCDFAQGFHFGRPGGADRIVRS